MKYLKLFTIVPLITILFIGCGGGSVGAGDEAGSSEGGVDTPIGAQMEALRSIDTIIENMDVAESDPAFASASTAKLSSYKEASPPEDEDDGDQASGFQSGIRTAQILNHNAYQALMRGEVFLRFLEASLETGEISADDIAGLSGHVVGLLRSGHSKFSIEAISKEYDTDKFEVEINACSSFTPHNRLIIRPSDGLDKTKVVLLGETDGMWIRTEALVGESRADTEIMGCMTDKESYLNCMKFHFENGDALVNFTSEWLMEKEGSFEPISGILRSSDGWTTTSVWVNNSFGLSGKISSDGEVKDVEMLASKPEGVMNISEMIASNDLLTSLDGLNLEGLIAMNDNEISALFRSWNGELQVCADPSELDDLPQSLERKIVRAAARQNNREPKSDPNAMVKGAKGKGNSCKGTMSDGFCFPDVGYSINACEDIVGDYYFEDRDGYSNVDITKWLLEPPEKDPIAMSLAAQFALVEPINDNKGKRYLRISTKGDDACLHDPKSGDENIYLVIESSIFDISAMRLTGSYQLRPSKSDDGHTFFESTYCNKEDGCSPGTDAVDFTCNNELDPATVVNPDRLDKGGCYSKNSVKAKVRIQNSGGDDFKNVDLFLYGLQDGAGGRATKDIIKLRRKKKEVAY